MRQRAHPRSRGENRPAWVGLRLISGSSPLTRGKYRMSGPDPCRRGLIPAHAGKIPSGLQSPSVTGAHPRSRGENSMVAGAARAAAGSSPLTRGKYARPRVRVFDLGLIPAHAGKMAGSSSPELPDGAHPRSRGENRAGSKPQLSARGSSPLTRGKCCARGRRGARHGLIPAHAGKMP